MDTGNLKKIRTKNGLTQKEASEILDITKEYLSMIENGKRNPSDNLKIKMCNLYKMSISNFYLGLEQTKCFKNKI